MITIKDIAAKAGVAKSTVSNVLSGKKYVSPEIAEKVMKICKEIDYQPNFYAATLSAKTKINIIGLFLEESKEGKYRKFYSLLIEGILTAASKYNNSLLIYSGLDNVETTKKLKVGKSPIDGAIVLSPTINDGRVDKISKSLIPLILIGHSGDVAHEFDCVDTDNVGLTYTISKKMMEQNYTNLCLINSKEELVISKERDAGLVKACKEVNNESYHIYHCKSTHGVEPYEYAKKGIENGCNAFICASGNVANGVYKACKEADLVIGKDVVVFSLGYSFDNTLKFEPELSYASQDYYRFGEIATKHLIDKINGETKSVKEIINSEFHIHESFKF